jgi:hypothetical protein
MSFASGAAGSGTSGSVSSGPVGAVAVAPAVSPIASGITPAPTDEEMVAIVAALELAWPRPVILLSAPMGPSKAASWRWSGRWWAAARR